MWCYFQYARLLLRGGFLLVVLIVNVADLNAATYRHTDNCKQQCFYIRDEIKEKKKQTSVLSGIYTHSGQGILSKCLFLFDSSSLVLFVWCFDCIFLY